MTAYPTKVTARGDGPIVDRECLGSLSASDDQRGSVGPFPQEPAPGSAEAVAVAADTIRWGFAPVELHDQQTDVILRERDELRAEVKRLRRAHAMLGLTAREEALDGQVHALANALAVAARELSVLRENISPSVRPRMLADCDRAIAIAEDGLRLAGRLP